MKTFAPNTRGLNLVTLLALFSFFSFTLNAQQVSFQDSMLNFTSGLFIPTSLDFGPDNRLYVTTQFGVIHAYTIVRNGEKSYDVTSDSVITIIQTIPNHNDDGAPHAVQQRQVTGIATAGTAANPVLYISNSDYRIGGGSQGTDKNLDTNSGIITKLTWNGSSWDMVHLVRGLPRSEENHATNDLFLDVANQMLYVAEGGHTNMGAPSNNFVFTPEYALSAAILSIDLAAIEALPTLTDGAGQQYKYDLPTLDDEDKTNVSTTPGYEDQGDPWGGNEGKNQAMLVAGGPVQVHASGFRNPYDVVITQAGRMYSFDNGPNVTWGGPPISNCSNDTNEQNSAYYEDNLHYITAAGYYAGHPNPTRANRNNTFNTTNPQTPIPVGMEDPSCAYLIPGIQDGALAINSASTNGICEYTATNFSGAMVGDLLAVSYNNGKILRYELNAAGNQVTNVSEVGSGFGSQPLDVVAQGDGDIFPGTFWVTVLGSNKIQVFEPTDFGVWSTVNQVNDPTQRHENGFVELGGKFYLLGGRGSSPIKPVQIFDPNTLTWTNGATPPIELHHFQAVPFNGKIYVLGAFTGNFPNETGVANVYVYDPPPVDAWSVSHTIPVGRRRGAAGAVVYNNEIYVVGGLTNGHIGGWVPWLDRYNPTSGTWTTLPDAPRTRDHFHAALAGDKIYCAGGRRTGDGGSTFDSTVVKVDFYDITWNSWTTLGASGDIPTPRAGTSVAYLGSEVLVIGGESGTQSQAHDETEALDVNTNTWRALAPLVVGRHGTQCLTYNGDVYISCGSSTQGATEITSTEVFKDFINCSGQPNNCNLDDDEDGYSNCDETLNGTDPCNPASRPDDFDSDFLSNLLDLDDDNDGLSDSTDFFARDSLNGTNKFIPTSYTFDGSPQGGIENWGFTGLMTNYDDNYQDLYNPDSMTVGGASLKFTINNITAGDAVFDNQANGFQFGVNVGCYPVPYVAHATLSAPIFGGSPVQDFMSYGMYIGNGDQDNYLKLAVGSKFGTVGLELRLEINGVENSVIIPDPTVVNATSSVDLYFIIDPVGNTALPLYLVDGAPGVSLGPAIPIPGAWIEDVMAMGIISTSFGAVEYPATWDTVEVVPVISSLTEANFGVSPASDIHANSMDPGSWILINSAGQKKLTQFTVDLTSSLLPDLVFDPWGTAGDGVFQDLIVNFDGGATGYQGRQYLKPHDGDTLDGWDQLQMDFTTFDQGDFLSWSVEVDPTSIKGSTGTTGSSATTGKVSGVEMIGAKFWAEFDDGSTQVGQLWRLPNGHLGASSNKIKEDKPPTPSIQVLGLTDDTVSTIQADQTVRITAPSGTNVSLLIAEGGLFKGGLPGGGYDIEPFENNRIVDLQQVDTVMPLSGWLDIPVTLTRKNNNSGFNHIVAVSYIPGPANETSYLSNRYLIELKEPPCENIRINCFSSANYIAANGDTFFADAHFYPNPGLTYANWNIPDILSTVDDPLYHTERYGDPFEYKIPVKPGNYRVKLHFAEIFWGATGAGPGSGMGIPGERVFDVSIEGILKLDDYDIIADVGVETAVIKTFVMNNVDDTLNIFLTASVDNAKLSAIEAICINGPIIVQADPVALDTSGVVIRPKKEDDAEPIPFRFDLYPNPTDGSEVNITLEGLPSREPLILTVTDVEGKEVRRESSECDFDGSLRQPIRLPDDIADGIYLLTVRTPKEIYTKRLVIMGDR